MTDAEAIAHLENRMHKLKDLYVDRFPRWTNGDYVAVHLLLALLAQVRYEAATAERGETAAQTQATTGGERSEG